MLSLRIGNMWRPSAELFVLILLCISSSCGEARPGISFRNHASSAKRMVSLGSMQRKILQDQKTPIWAESKDALVQKTEKQAYDRKWEPEAEEKKEWIAEPKEVDEALRLEKKAARELIMMGKKNEAWDVGLRVEKEQTKLEESNREWHPELKAESEQISVKKETRYEEPKTESEQSQVEKTKGEALHQDQKARVKETNVYEKTEQWKPDEERHVERQVVGQVEPSADEKSEKWEEKPVTRFKDEEWKVVQVEEKKEPTEKTQVEKTKGETLHQDPKAQGKETNVYEKTEQWKSDEERHVERKVVGQVEPSADEKSEKWEEKPVTRFKDEEWKAVQVEEKKQPREDSQEDKNNEEPKVKMQEERKNEERKDFKVEDGKVESKIDDIKEVPKVEERNLESNRQIKKEEKLGENDERKMKSQKVENKVEAIKVQDKKEEEVKIELTHGNKEDKDRKSSISSEVEEGRPVQAGIEEDMHSDFDEDYPDFLDELRNFPERFQKTAESVKDHIRDSGLDKYSMHSKELFDQANQQIEESFTPLLGKDYAPFLAYLVSYGLLLLPLALVTYLFDRIRARFSLQKILLFVNIYLSAYFAALLAVALALDSEPMNFFMEYSPSSYIFLQLLQAFGYLIYLLLNTADLISTCSNARIAAKTTSLLQWVVVVAVGFHYYVTVFHRAMVRKAPLTGWKIYGLYSISFVFLCLFARIERGKKQYAPREVDDTTDKKN